MYEQNEGDISEPGNRHDYHFNLLGLRFCGEVLGQILNDIFPYTCKGKNGCKKKTYSESCKVRKTLI